MQKKFPKHVYFNFPHENAPEFVIGKIRMSKFEFMAWLQDQPVNNKGCVDLDVLMGKNGKPYLAIDSYGLPKDDTSSETTESGMDVPPQENNSPQPQIKRPIF